MRSAKTRICSSPATRAIVCAVMPRSSGSPSPPPRTASATRPCSTSACASAARLCVSVSGSTEASTNTLTLREHDRLRARELDERGAVELGAVLERLELAQDAEQPPVRLAAALADRVEQLGQRGVGLDRQRLGGPHVGHPGGHVLARDADEVRAVVDAQPVRVDLVHEVAGLARVEPLADHRLVADGQADEHVEVLGALAARRGGEQPAVGDRAEADLRERAVRVGGGVDVAQRLVGHEQVPGDRLQVGGVAVEQAVGGEHDAGALAERAVERADLPGDRAVLGRARARRRWAPAAAGRARARRRSARRATGRAAGPRRRRARGSAA